MGQSVYQKFGTSQIAGSDQTQQRHTIGGDETMPMIASDRYNVEFDSQLWRQIAEANGIADLDALQVGQVIIVPTPLPVST
jgi:nucleoid-associated protein YgaU